MKVSKWVDMGQEVDVDICMEDIRIAIEEELDSITEDRLGDPGPNVHEIKRVLNSIAVFLKALTDEQITLLGGPSQMVVGEFLKAQAQRYIDAREKGAAA